MDQMKKNPQANQKLTYLPSEAVIERLSKIVRQQTLAQQRGIVDCLDCQLTLAISISAYRCLYCEGWFCVSCAERHFGKTRLEFYEQHFARTVQKHD